MVQGFVSAIGYSWLEGLLIEPLVRGSNPQVLGYSGLRVAEPLVRGSNPSGARVHLHSWRLGPHMSNQVTPCRIKEGHREQLVRGLYTEALVRGSDPSVAGEILRGRGLGTPHVQSGYTLT